MDPAGREKGGKRMHATRRVRAALVLAACAGAGVALLAYPPTRAVIRTAGWGAAFAVLLSPLCGALERVMHRGPAIALSMLAALLLVCLDRKSTRLNSSHVSSSYAVLC